MSRLFDFLKTHIKPFALGVLIIIVVSVIFNFALFLARHFIGVWAEVALFLAVVAYSACAVAKDLRGMVPASA